MLITLHLDVTGFILTEHYDACTPEVDRLAVGRPVHHLGSHVAGTAGTTCVIKHTQGRVSGLLASLVDWRTAMWVLGSSGAHKLPIPAWEHLKLTMQCHSIQPAAAWG